jgi:hypothetical protein
MNPGLAEGGIMQTPNIDHTATRSKRNRRMVTIGAGALALMLAIIATVAAVGGGSPATQAREPLALVPSPATIASQSPSDHVASKPAKKAKGSAPSAPTAPVLADGTYPTYVTNVDVDGAMITVDVIQVFQDEAAVKAALEDGVQDDVANFLYIYVRNQNPLLRTLGVARNVRIVFLDGCEAPDRTTGLKELAKVTKHFDDLYYYDITVANGVIDRIIQRIAQAAC